MSEQRDAEADLAVCQAATPGPWQADPAFGTPWTVGGDLLNFDRCVTVCETYPEGGIKCPQEDYEQAEADARFIAIAREALPWWIEKAQRPTPTAKLEAWAEKAPNRDFEIGSVGVEMWEERGPETGDIRVVIDRRYEPEPWPNNTPGSYAEFVGRSEDDWASTDEAILAALAKWEELYGE